MPRKQNGFGNAGSFNFKAGKDISKGKFGAAGRYPGRQYGSSVGRTVVEQYDLNSDWVKWRKGFEYYNKGAWYGCNPRSLHPDLQRRDDQIEAVSGHPI